MNKTCTKCGETKVVEEFYRHKSMKDGWMSRCKVCHSKSVRVFYKANREEILAREKKRYEANPGKTRSASRKRRKENRFAYALDMSRHAAGQGGWQPCNATIEELKAAFAGKCEICAVPELELTRRLCVDHDHETGEFRGFLCSSCNKLLGQAKDSQDILINSLHYLMSDSRQQQE